MSANGPNSLTDLTFEEAYERLDAVLVQLQVGNMTLDESLASYEDGMGLAAHCQALLDAAELRIETLERATQDVPEDDEPPF